MTLPRRQDDPDGKFTLAFVGCGEESDPAVLGVTHNRGVEKYELGTAYGHIAPGVADMYAAVDKIRAAAGKPE